MTNQHELELDRRGYFLAKAADDWEDCWCSPLNNKIDSLPVIFESLLYGYDGPVQDIEDHLMEFFHRWIEMRADKLEEEAEEDARQAQMDSAADRDLFIDREDW